MSPYRPRQQQQNSQENKAAATILYVKKPERKKKTTIRKHQKKRLDYRQKNRNHPPRPPRHPPKQSTWFIDSPKTNRSSHTDNINHIARITQHSQHKTYNSSSESGIQHLQQRRNKIDWSKKQSFERSGGEVGWRKRRRKKKNQRSGEGEEIYIQFAALATSWASRVYRRRCSRIWDCCYNQPWRGGDRRQGIGGDKRPAPRASEQARGEERRERAREAGTHPVEVARQKDGWINVLISSYSSIHSFNQWRN